MKYRRWLPLVMPVLWLAVLGSASQVIYARHKARDMFVHLEKLNAERDSLDMDPRLGSCLWAKWLSGAMHQIIRYFVRN